MWHSLPLHLVASHSEEGYEKEAFAKEGTGGETCISIKPGLAGDWCGGSIYCECKWPSESALEFIFSFFLLLAKITESAKTRFNKYKNNSKLLIS